MKFCQAVILLELWPAGALKINLFLPSITLDKPDVFVIMRKRGVTDEEIARKLAKEDDH